MKKRYLQINLLFLAGLFFLGSSCVQDRLDYEPPEVAGKDMEEVEFSIRLPGIKQTVIRALDKNDEDFINELAMLVFDPQGNFVRIAYPRPLSQNPDASGYRKFVVKLKRGKSDLMLLANSGDCISDYLGRYPSGFNPGASRSDIIRLLQINLTGKWNADSESEGYKHFPMWAVRTNVQIDKNTDLQGENGFHLARALARVNLDVKPDMSNRSDFELVDIRFYHRRNKGQLIPNEKEWFETSGGSVSKPSLVDNSDVLGPLLYNGAAIKEDGSCTNEIYVLEAPKGDMDLHPAYSCLVVGARYKNQMGYYRIDFGNNTEGQLVHMDILRNFTYNITITSVSGPGFPDPGEAYESLPVNIEARVVGWNEEKVGDIYFDGQHFLRIEKGRYFLNSNARETQTSVNALFIETDYGGGWAYKGIEYDGAPGQDWLEFMGEKTGLAVETADRWLKVGENKTDETRTASIFIDAGRIRGTIKVTQDPQSELSLSIYKAGLAEEIADGATLTYTSDFWTEEQTCSYVVECSQTAAEIDVYLINPLPGYDKLRFIDEESVLQGGMLKGYNTYEESFGMELFRRPDKGVFPQQALEYMFVARHEGQTVTRRFKVVHKYADLQTTALGACMQGRFYEIGMDYNTDWEVSVSGNHAILDAEVTSASKQLVSESDVSGPKTNAFRVKLKVGKEYDGETAIIRFMKHGTDQVFAEVPVTSYYNYPNSYTVDKNQSVDIDVMKAFRMWESYLPEEEALPLQNGNYTAEYVWADFNIGDANQSLSITLNLDAGDQSKSTIRVQGHNDHYGSVVVALLLNGKIVWSWHVWILDDRPAEGFPKLKGIQYFIEGTIPMTLMDRNLGAKSNWLTSDGYETSDGLGLYYQWGRKDPFPPPESSRFATDKKLGGGGNITISNNSRFYVGTTGMGNAPTTDVLRKSIENPNLFFTPEFEPYDWYPEGNDPRKSSTTLWRPVDGLKSEFDPCPAGWRVANYNVFGGRYHYSISFGITQPGTMVDYGWLETSMGDVTNCGYLDRIGVYQQTGAESWLWYGCIDNDDGRYNPLLGLADRAWFVGGAIEHQYRHSRFGMPKATGMPVRCETDETRYWPSWE